MTLVQPTLQGLYLSDNYPDQGWSTGSRDWYLTMSAGRNPL